MKQKLKKSLSGVLCTFALYFIISISTTVAQEFPKLESKHWTTKYDDHFRKYSKRFFGVGFDWRWFKAQAIAESGLKEDAKSWVNAKGIMQLMPRTFEEIKKKNPSFVNVNEPRWNIAAGIYYDNQQYGRWKNLSFTHRIKFTFASYNAGYSTIHRAQNMSKIEGFDGNAWNHIESVAQKVKRWRYKETLGYIEKITNMMPE
ncbi:transglycosylase SLT domain-containing protein [candidate division KSB1 bacterium]